MVSFVIDWFKLLSVFFIFESKFNTIVSDFTSKLLSALHALICSDEMASEWFVDSSLILFYN